MQDIGGGIVLANPRSLRFRALAVVLAVTLLPLVWVFTATWADSADGLTLQRSLFLALQAGSTAKEKRHDLKVVATGWQVRLRVLSSEGAVIFDHDGSRLSTWYRPVAEPFFGPTGTPSLQDADAELDSLSKRTEVLAATKQPAASCSVVQDGLMLLCGAALRMSDGSVIHVEKGSPRLVRSLYAQRWQMLWLSLVVLVFGSLLALWVGTRMVRPIEQLRDQVVARTKGLLRTEPVVLNRNDELGELADAFNELLSALEKRNTSNARFAADLAHELKNPVAAVCAVAEMLEGHRAIEGERRERLTRVLQDSSDRLQTVVDRFLQLARAEAGLQEAVREPVQLRELLNALVAIERADVRSEGVSFEVQGPEVVVEAASERLETAFRNLLTNAAHFARPTGQVLLRITAGPAEVRVEIHDSGPGIPESDQERIWERYYTQRQGGTGLGLPLTRAIAHAHGALVSVRPSELLQGACFEWVFYRGEQQ